MILFIFLKNYYANIFIFSAIYHGYEFDGITLDFFYLDLNGVNELINSETWLKHPTQTFYFLPLSFQKVLRKKIAVLQGHEEMGVLVTDNLTVDLIHSIQDCMRRDR